MKRSDWNAFEPVEPIPLPGAVPLNAPCVTSLSPRLIRLAREGCDTWPETCISLSSDSSPLAGELMRSAGAQVITTSRLISATGMGRERRGTAVLLNDAATAGPFDRAAATKPLLGWTTQPWRARAAERDRSGSGHRSRAWHHAGDPAVNR